ncbi:VOC family protein [Anaerolineales bacterium HSG25]|nr:VOC family protein [Anaerolineales bacterium HSG25]
MFKRLAHICIGATDLQATSDFYCDILGLKKQFKFDRDGEIIGFYLFIGETTFIEVFADSTSPAREQGQLLLKHFCLEVNDMDEVITTIRAKGGEITDKKFGIDNAWQAWLTDPSGVEIELHQYTSESSHFTGQDCVVDW